MTTDIVTIESPSIVEEVSEESIDVSIVEYDIISCMVNESSCLVDIESSSIIEVESVNEVVTVEASSPSVDIVMVDVGIPGPCGRDGFEWTTTQW